MGKRMKKFKEKIISGMGRAKLKFAEEMRSDEGIGVVEIILILLVLVGIVVIFKSQISTIAKSVFGNITNQVNNL